MPRKSKPDSMAALQPQRLGFCVVHSADPPLPSSLPSVLLSLCHFVSCAFFPWAPHCDLLPLAAVWWGFAWGSVLPPCVSFWVGSDDRCNSDTSAPCTELKIVVVTNAKNGRHFGPQDTSHSPPGSTWYCLPPRNQMDGEYCYEFSPNLSRL